MVNPLQWRTDGARAAFDFVVTPRLSFAVFVVVLLVFGAWQWSWNTAALNAWMTIHPWLGAALYVVALSGSVVLVPFSSLPLLPLAASHFGVLPAALLSALGWWLGAIVAFGLARLGRPWLERITSLDVVDRLEARIPPDLGFGGIVLLRMVLPVDVVSFALGLLKRLPFRTYAIASMVGILPFAFVWSYAGGELSAGRWVVAAVATVALVAVAAVIRRRWVDR